MEEVVFADDGYKAVPSDEIVIDDRPTSGNAGTMNDSSGARAASQERTRIAADGSQITTMYDGFGNKTETRFFNDNFLLQDIMLRTSVKGEKQIFVFGQNGTVINLPVDMADKVLTAPANELAVAAGISEGRKAQTIENSQMNRPLTPLPASAFPIRTPMPPAAAVIPSTETVEETSEPEKTEPAPAETVKQIDENSSASKKKSDKQPSNKQPAGQPQN